MAKGNNGNYLQHCIEIEAAERLVRSDPERRLHVALTHGMKPFERLCETSSHTRCNLLRTALREAASAPRCGERKIVEAYRKSWASIGYRPDVENLYSELSQQERYPNTAELLRAVIGTDRLSGGITETNEKKYKRLVEAWSGSQIVSAHSSWRDKLCLGGALACPDRLDRPWLLSMDPMTYTETGCDDDDKLHRSDLDRLVSVLEPYIASGKLGIMSLFVFGMGVQGNNPQRQFWGFMDDLARRLSVPTRSYWVPHQGGNLNLAGLLFSDEELVLEFSPPDIQQGRGRNT